MQGNIVIPSWELVNKADLIKKFNFFPSILSTIFLSLIVLYQTAYSYIIIFQKKDQFFSLVIDIVHKSYFIEILICFIIGFLVYILIIPIAKSGVYYLIDAFYKQDIGKYKLSYGISQGLLSFLPLFEFNNFMGLFKLLSVITSYLFCLRIFGNEYIGLISAILGIYFIFALIINILFIYATFFIIFEKKGLFESLSLSAMMTISNLGVTFKLYYTLFLVYARIIIIVIVFSIFSLIFSAIFAYITSKFFFIIGIYFMMAIFILFVLFIAHLNSVLEIFVDSLWYKTYIENMKDFPNIINKSEDEKDK
ncbi:hypothetical protein KAZ01_00660 [Candidatus Gracilibacteria bacterium]|nr:hypothetical protein [Candidatus Gracilibacteria bacterium]